MEGTSDALRKGDIYYANILVNKKHMQSSVLLHLTT
jgi:hypothetical protein